MLEKLIVIGLLTLFAVTGIFALFSDNFLLFAL